MKLNFVMVLLLLLTIQTVFANDSVELTQQLQEKLTGLESGDFISVNINLRDQLDSELLYEIVKDMPKAERREYTISQLKSHSEKTQKSLINLLVDLQNKGAVKDINPLWVTNKINTLIMKSALDNLMNHPDIQFIDYNAIRKIIRESKIQDIEESTTQTREITYNLTKMNVPQVWQQGYTGTGAVVAVLDTGVNYNHNDIRNNMWTHTNYPNHGYNTFDNSHVTMDGDGHGTHCAGTVAGDGSSGSQTGVAPNAKIMAVKVLNDNGEGSEYSVMQGIQFAINNGADVISMSLGWSHAWNPNRTAWRNSMNNVLNAGMVAVAAAGNEGNEQYQYPIPDNIATPSDIPPPWRNPDQPDTGSRSGVISIGASNAYDQVASFSSRGPVTWQNVTNYNDYPYNPGVGLIRPDVVAPGVDVKSLRHNSNTGYTTMSGTSMSTPAAAGVIALFLSKNPDITPELISQVLETYAQSLTTSKSNVSGAGRINALASINGFQEQTMDPPVNLTAITGDGMVMLSWEAPDGTIAPPPPPPPPPPPGELTMLRQHTNVHDGGYYQSFGAGYGVVFNLSSYPGATLERVDFRHASWELNGTWQYKVHIINWSTFQTVSVLGPFNTTVNDNWEMEINLNSAAGNNGMMAILIEPMSGDSEDAYPCLSTDGTLNGTSVLVDLSNPSNNAPSTEAGDFLIDLWVLPAGRNEITQVNPAPHNLIATSNNFPHRSKSIADFSHNDSSVRNDRNPIGYNVYRNNVRLNNTPQAELEYFDTNVVNGTTYSYYVKAVYSGGESVPSNTIQATPTGDTPPPNLPPPTNLTASVQNNSSVYLDWDGEDEEPGGYEGWITWDNGEFDNIIGTNSAVQFKVASRFSSQNLNDIDAGGSYLTHVKFVPAEQNCVYTINVWTGGNSNSPGQLVAEQVVSSPVINDWNNIQLNNPVLINASQELWFGYSVNTQAGYPAGADTSPAVNGFGNMMYFNNAWTTLTALLPSANYNWCLQAYLSNNTTLTNNDDIDFEAMNNTRLTLLGYNVYRNSTRINTSTIISSNYTDYTPQSNTNLTYFVTAVYSEGESQASNSVNLMITNADEQLNMPLTTELRNNYPNPFNPETTINFSIAETANVTLDVYNIKGQHIVSLLNKELNAGNHSLVWNGSNSSGDNAGSGIYLFRMKSGSYTATKKMILMK